MKIETYKYPKSSFLSVDKDLATIVDRIIENDRLKKLLYYPSKDCLSRDNLNEDQTLDVIKNNIKIIPKLLVDNKALNYIHIRFDNFIQNGNPEFRDNTIEFDIICHIDSWQLDNNALRPFKIVAELDSMFNNSKMSGIGKLEFVHCSEIVLTDEFMGYCLLYQAVHGGDDQVDAYDPREEADLIKNFNKMFNS